MLLLVKGMRVGIEQKKGGGKLNKGKNLSQFRAVLVEEDKRKRTREACVTQT